MIVLKAFLFYDLLSSLFGLVSHWVWCLFIFHLSFFIYFITQYFLTKSCHLIIVLTSTCLIFMTYLLMSLAILWGLLIVVCPQIIFCFLLIFLDFIILMLIMISSQILSFTTGPNKDFILSWNFLNLLIQAWIQIIIFYFIKLKLWLSILINF